jgi:hypothetical protein
MTRSRRAEAMALPAWIKPQLTKLVDAPPEGPEWLHEIKFDGYRMHARLDRGAVRLMTRTGLDWTHKYPVMALCNLIAEPLHLRFVGDIGDVRGDAQALRQPRRLAELLRFCHRVRKDVAHHDAAAFGNQLANELPAHPGAAARDDCDPACEVLHASSLPLCFVIYR